MCLRVFRTAGAHTGAQQTLLVSIESSSTVSNRVAVHSVIAQIVLKFFVFCGRGAPAFDFGF